MKSNQTILNRRKVMKKHIYLFLLGCFLLSSGPVVMGIASDYSDRYKKLQLKDLIAGADIIVDGVSAVRGVYDDVALRDVRVHSVLFENKSMSSVSVTNSLIVITPKNTYTADSPNPVSGKHYIMFLKRSITKQNLGAKLHDLGKPEMTYEFLEGWQSCLSLEFKEENLAIKLFREVYGIDNSIDVLNAIEELSKWRQFDTKKEQMKYLFDLWNTKRSQKIYDDTIPQMIEYLGGHIIQRNGKNELNMGLEDIIIRDTINSN